MARKETARAKGQASIERFFSNPNRLRSFEIPPPIIKKSTAKLDRQGSFLSTATDDDNAGFEDEDDMANSSVDTSIEMSNFKSIALNRVLSSSSSSSSHRRGQISPAILQEKKNSSRSINVSTLNDKSPSQLNEARSASFAKRTASDFLENADFDGLARKLQRTQEKQQTVDAASTHLSQDTYLSDEQLDVIDAAVNRKLNIFYTGSAGTGKSVVLRELVKQFKMKYRDNVGVTAPTGMAACNIQGQTIFKFLEIAMGNQPVDVLVKRIESVSQKLRKWQQLQVLIIDEISMISGDLFDKLEEVARRVRRNNKPFGGIQIVCSGDFFQLPPVGKANVKPKLCFQANAWIKVIEKTIVLKQVFRQKGDTELIDMLNALRLGELTTTIVNKFKSLSRSVEYTDGIEPTELYPRKDDVARSNNRRMQRLPGETVHFKAIDYAANENYRDQFNQLMCEEELSLKEGAQVMNIKNIDDELVNGSLGTVLFFTTQGLFFKILSLYDELDVDDAQMLGELRLLRKKIGHTDEWSESDLKIIEKIPDSRKPKFEALVQIAIQETTEKLLPVVNFNFNGRYEAKLVQRQDFPIDVSSRSGAEKPYREQLPLILAWAMSIHKSQGQTLPRVKIDLARIFEFGQAYVALSRAVSKDHLEVKGFSADKVKTSQDVIDFYKKITS
ncbi:uncharacterized protein LODBEIA_P10400 [Lodderomyces beijingensis]|uniref:ATP-dependent DNA helicase PIF1 n=1 Tax=Lodderomyces beijingensis TaxID=1775926 RepID=A0ABP0ZI86_9ASCO